MEIIPHILIFIFALPSIEGQVDLYNLLECGEESEEWTQTASKKQE